MQPRAEKGPQGGLLDALEEPEMADASHAELARAEHPVVSLRPRVGIVQHARSSFDQQFVGGEGERRHRIPASSPLMQTSVK